MSDAIVIRSLGKQFGDFIAVRNVSFTVAAGENFALLGPNGAGKSTLIRLLTTLMRPTSGTAIVGGHDVMRDPDGVRMQIGVIPQAMTSDPDLTADENLEFHAKLYGVRRAERRRLADPLLAAVGLVDFRQKLVGTFSGGMRRRLEIARSLMHRPRILFLDEPTTGLDPASRVAMWKMLRDLKSITSLTVFLTTHYMEEADQLCDRVAIFDHGRVVALDTPEGLKAQIPGEEAIEVAFPWTPGAWHETVAALPGVSHVTAANGAWRIASIDRIATVRALLDAAHAHQVTVASLAVRGRTLDDVFLHYTGRDLRDAADGKVRRDYTHLYDRPVRA
jgi:ABC-2 type transport system ATP-binding protein